jgi:hypothetical protein
METAANSFESRRWMIEDLSAYYTGSRIGYNCWFKLALPNFHEIHILQINRLHEQTGLDTFAYYRDR